MTTRTLDFAHVFARSEIRSFLAEHLIEQCIATKSRLHAYVIMVNHVHFLLRLNENLVVSEFVQKYKGDTAKKVLKSLEPYELQELSSQSVLNQRQLWAFRYRALPIVSQHMFSQKVRYIHQNPVRAKQASSPEKCRHSSALFYEQGLWNPDEGLDLVRCLDILRERD